MPAIARKPANKGGASFPGGRDGGFPSQGFPSRGLASAGFGGAVERERDRKRKEELHAFGGAFLAVRGDGQGVCGREGL